MMKQTIRTAFVSSLPVMAGYLVLGFGFGILLQQAGYSILWAFCMSLTIYAGAMQYVAVALLSSGASLLTAALTTFIVQARHLFYGISMLTHYRGAGKYKPYLMFALTDETYSLLCNGKAPNGLPFHRYAFFLSLFNQIYWIAGGVLGATVGTLVAFNSRGVDFSMTALFITVFVEQWRSTKNHLPAIIGVAVSLVSLLIFGADRFLIPAMLGIGVMLCLGKGLIEKKEVTGDER